MTKLLIAVRSCQRDLNAGLHQKIRATWGQEAKALGMDTRFFVGAKFQPYASDEVHVQCRDEVDGLPFKTREICKWATGKMVDYLFLCYTTSVVDPKSIGPVSQWDYVGKFQSGVGLRFPWASGREGYLLSRKAFTEIAYAYPGDLPEDVGVGQTLGALASAGEITLLDVK